jgi:hypothetical protein
MRESRWSWKSNGSVLSIASEGSVLSIGSVGSVLSIGSIGSAGSALSIGSAYSAASVLSFASRGSLLSSIARDSILGSPAGVRQKQAIVALTIAALTFTWRDAWMSPLRDAGDERGASATSSGASPPSAA